MQPVWPESDPAQLFKKIFGREELSSSLPNLFIRIKLIRLKLIQIKLIQIKLIQIKLTRINLIQINLIQKPYPDQSYSALFMLSPNDPCSHPMSRDQA